MDFAKNNYKNIIYLNFFENQSYKDIFAGSLEVDDLIMYMSATAGPEISFEPGTTVIILDEIQECPEARTALKFIHLDGRFDCIGTGSLLGVSGYRDNPISIPVGYESIIEMTPLDFEEFVWANGVSDKMISELRKCLKEERPVPVPIHRRMQGLLLQYVVVGGMPEVVQTFVDTKQMNRVLDLQRDIINSYEDDMIKHASRTDKARIRECFRSIPKQLAKENKKFQYSVIKKGSTASSFAGCLQWIEDAGIIARCYNLSITELPLDGNAIPEIFKVYMRDTGLEIDFVTRYEGRCTLVEVKAKTGNAKSLKTVLKHPEKYHVFDALKFGEYNIGRQGQVLTLPLYMGAFI